MKLINANIIKVQAAPSTSGEVECRIYTFEVRLANRTKRKIGKKLQDLIHSVTAERNTVKVLIPDNKPISDLMNEIEARMPEMARAIRAASK